MVAKANVVFFMNHSATYWVVLDYAGRSHEAYKSRREKPVMGELFLACGREKNFFAKYNKAKLYAFTHSTD